MNRFFKNRIFQSLIVFSFLTIFCVYFYLYRKNVSYLFYVLGCYEAGLIFLSIATQFGVRVWCEKIHYHSIGYNIPTSSLYLVAAKQNILNYLPMKAGTIYSASILKSRYNISVSHFSAVFAAQTVLILSITLLAAAIALLLSSAGSNETYISTIVLTFSAFFTFAVLLLPMPRFKKMPDSINTHIDMINDGIYKCKHKPKLLLVTISLRFIALLLMAWRFQMLLTLSGEPVSLAISLILSASTVLSLLISITPAGIGIREALFAATSDLLMVSSGVAVIVSVLERIFILSFCGLIVITASVYNSLQS